MNLYIDRLYELDSHEAEHIQTLKSHGELGEDYDKDMELIRLVYLVGTICPNREDNDADYLLLLAKRWSVKIRDYTIRLIEAIAIDVGGYSGGRRKWSLCYISALELRKVLDYGSLAFETEMIPYLIKRDFSRFGTPHLQAIEDIVDYLGNRLYDVPVMCFEAEICHEWYYFVRLWQHRIGLWKDGARNDT